MITDSAAWTPPGILTQTLTEKTEHKNPLIVQLIEADGIQAYYLEHGTGHMMHHVVLDQVLNAINLAAE